MIREQDLEEAIAECLGDRNPNANTCIKLAAFYTIKQNLFPEANDSERLPSYSFAPPPVEPVGTVTIDSDTEFSQAVAGMPISELMPIMDELMSTIQAIAPRLYDSVMRRLT